MSSNPTRGDLTLLDQWKLGDQDAASEFYTRYVEKLLSLMQRNIARRFAPRFEPADVVQSVMRTFFGRVSSGKLSLSEQDDVWKLLLTIALCKARNRVKFHEAAGRSVNHTSSGDALDQLGEPSEQDAVDVFDLVETTARSLDARAARVMDLILANWSIEEIAAELSVTTRSIRRYRDQIAKQLQRRMN
jgi:DNA-directed RNA polymerase specialized sigma24 family protein